MIRLAIVSALVLTSAYANPSALALTYNVRPVDLLDGYTISGGYITTNGMIGPLSASDFLDYRLEVDGDFPFIFQPTNTAAEVIVDGIVEATPTEILLPTTTDRNRLTFISEVSPIGVCTLCNQFLRYAQGINSFRIPLTHYRYNVFPGGDGTPERNDLVNSVLNLLPQVDVTVASIPEPTTSTLALAALCLVIGRRPSY